MSNARDGSGRLTVRTKPFDDGEESLRTSLQTELRKAVAPWVVVVVGPDLGSRVRLDRSVTLGRDPEAELSLRDENISWRHARIEDRGGGEWVLVDLGSTNGTFVRGERTSEVRLFPGDRLLVGRTVVEFEQPDAIREGFHHEIERLLSVDELSGLWVKRRFDAELELRVAALLRGTLSCLSVLVMDMDGIKAINDTHGHDFGAFAIATCGQVLGKTLGERGFATRFGGDEFAATLVGVSKVDALEVAEELRRAVVEHPYQYRGETLNPGLSVGVATLPGDAQDAAGVFRAADAAMYRAKRTGKNRVST
ncbi:MAG: GGDEF domain-containing protein [Myxococcales bacterium]|jgi:diguanylate cyclase (GGDEF)-like protein